MTTYSAAYPSKTSWSLKLVVDETDLEPENNRSYVEWQLRLYRGNSDTPYNNAGSAYSVTGPGGVSGTFPAYRFGATGTGTNYSSTPVGGYVVIASGGAWVDHDPDGSKSITVAASHAAAATLGTATITSKTLALTTLTQVPAVPSSVALARVSDSSADLTWADTSESNGQPVTNQVQTSVNGAAFSQVASISAATALAIACAANQKVIAKVRATNAAGSSAYSSETSPIFTTPAAPTGVTATKEPDGDIVVAWTPNVAFTEHQHIIEHGVDVAGVITWDGSALATITAGTSTYTHTTPNPAQVHVYRVKARNTDVGALASANVVSNSVQLLIAPNAPTLGTVPTYADEAANLGISWVHNPVDTTAQTAYEFGFSVDGGDNWTSTGKVTSGTALRTIAGGTYDPDDEVTVRVRTWGSATSGGSDGTGASAWSSTKTVTFKTKPTGSITSPVDASTLDGATLTVVLGFSQPESGTFVQATIRLYNGVDLLEQIVSTTLAGTVFATKLVDGESYTVTATVHDSHGLVSAEVEVDFDVDFTLPVAAAVTVSYLEDSGFAQIGVVIPAAGGGEAEATAVTITRTIDGAAEVVHDEYPVSVGSFTFLDPTPTINGVNVYTVTTISGDGATVDEVENLTTSEGLWAFLNTGDGYTQIVKFFGNLTLGSTPTRESALVAAAGRTLPIALFGDLSTLEVPGSATILVGEGSTVEEIETFLRTAGKVCYRDPTGRRIFGSVRGSFNERGDEVAEFSYVVSEAT